MDVNLFSDQLDLDTEFLNDTYADDPETAVMMFENYLQELPENFRLIEESYQKSDVETFRHLVHKLKPIFSYVGLTDVSEKFHQLQIKCQEVNDLDTFKDDIQFALSRIQSSTPIIQSTLEQLRQR